MIKKSLIPIFFLISILLLGLVAAQNTQQTAKIKIEIPQNQKTITPGEKLSLKVSLYDSQNKLIKDTVSLTIQDPKKTTKIEKNLSSNEITEIDLGENPLKGDWIITAKYQNVQDIEIISIETNELVKFELNNDVLKITNLGNTPYEKTIKITIGTTVGTKDIKLSVNEATDFRLIAPEGNYNIEVTDGKTTLTRSDVSLTGNVIGIIDEKVADSSSLTGGIHPEESNEIAFAYLKNGSFVYIFVLVIFGAMILLTIERFYKRKASKRI